MSKRTKPTPEIVANLPQAEGALAEMAAIDRQLALINGALNEALDAAKARAQTEGATLLARRGELEKSVSTFAKLNKAELFKDRKTLELNFGTITFLSSVRTVQQSGIDACVTVARLRQYGFLDAIRTKEEVNKETVESWPDERLDLIGMRHQTIEKVTVEPKSESITI